MKELYKKCLQNGVDLSYKNKIFISHFTQYGVINRKGYQVHTETKQPFSFIYRLNQLDQAIDKFEQLKNMK